MMLLAMPFFSMAQCATPLELTVLDTLVTGSGNAHHNFTFPKFHPGLGTLVDVKIETEVTLRYFFQLENRENVSINNYRVRIVREDEISGSALQIPFNNTFQRTYGPYALAANDGVQGSGADYVQQGPMYVMNDFINEYFASNTADYLGTGDVSLNYDVNTYSIVFGSVNYNFNGTAQDSVRFKVTYRYCQVWALAAELSSFTAVRTNQSVDVRWIVPNEKNNRNYVIETSTDGKSFRAGAAIPANTSGSYQHNYVPGSNESGKLVFRIKQVEADGKVKYSSVRVVDLGNKQASSIRIYPNPSTGTFNMVFHNTKRGDWKVEVLTASGQMIRRYEFSKALTGRIDISDLARGLYHIRTINKRSEEQFTQQVMLK